MLRSGSPNRTKSRRACVSAGTGWFNLLWLLPIGFVVLISAVAVAQALRSIPSVEDFIARYPGTLVSAEAHENPGFAVWVGVQHFFNLFLMIFVLRSGLQILSDHPRLYWTRHSTPGKDWFRFQKEVPTEGPWTAKQDSVSLPGQIGLPGLRHSIGLARWWHLGIDTLWLLNGLVFYLLLFATGHWRRSCRPVGTCSRMRSPFKFSTCRYSGRQSTGGSRTTASS